MLNQVVNIVVFSAPGVIIGGQVGPKLQGIIPEDKMKIGIFLAFVVIGVFMLYTIVP